MYIEDYPFFYLVKFKLGTKHINPDIFYVWCRILHISCWEEKSKVSTYVAQTKLCQGIKVYSDLVYKK